MVCSHRSCFDPGSCASWFSRACKHTSERAATRCSIRPMCRAEVPVPAQMWEGLSPVPAQMCRVKVPTMASHWRLEALRWYACVDYGASHRRWLLWTGIVSGQEALTFFLRTNLGTETLAQVPCHICTGTGHTAATSAPGTGPTAATSAPGLGAPPPHLHYDWVCRCHISTGTWSTAPLC